MKIKYQVYQGKHSTKCANRTCHSKIKAGQNCVVELNDYGRIVARYCTKGCLESQVGTLPTASDPRPFSKSSEDDEGSGIIMAVRRVVPNPPLILTDQSGCVITPSEQRRLMEEGGR